MGRLAPADIACLEAGMEVRDATLCAAHVATLLVETVRGERQLPRGLKIRNARLEGEFDLEGLNLPFPVYLNGCTFAGPVILRHARIKGLFVEGGRFEQVVDARDAVFDGQIVMRLCEFHRPVLLRDCVVQGQLNFLGARFLSARVSPRNWMEEHAWGQTLSLARSRIGSLKWESVALADHAEVDFTDLKLGSLISPMADADFGRVWPLPGRLFLDGIAIDRVERTAAPNMLRWLRLCPDFSPTAFRAVASAFQNAGLQRHAEEVAAEARRLEVQHLSSSARRWFFKAVYGVGGYGTRPFRVAILSALLLAGAMAVAIACRSAGMIAPASTELIFKDCYYQQRVCGERAVGWHAVHIRPGDEVRYVPEDYAPFSPVRFTVERAFPFIASSQRDSWDLSLPWISYLHRLLTVLTLFFAGIFVGTVSGILKPKD